MFRATLRLSAHYETPVPMAMFERPKMIKYRRRILNYHRLHRVPLTARRIQLGLTYLLLFTAGWCVFIEDWGETDKAFSAIRKWSGKKIEDFYQLTQEDIEELQARNKLN